MSTQAKAGMASVLAQGAQGLATGIMSRDEVKVARARSEQELEKLNYQEQTDSVKQQIDVINQQNQDLQRKLDKEETFTALRQYKADGNPRHLNRMFKSNPRISEAIGVTEVAALDPYSDADMKLIRAAGGNPANFKPSGLLDDSDEAEQVRRYRSRYIKSRMANGEWKVTDMQNVYAGTGFAATLNDEETAALLEKLRVDKIRRGPADTALVRNARATAEAQERIDVGKGTPEDYELIKFANKEKAGTTAGKLDMAEEATKTLIDSFGGEDTFFTTDFSNRANFTKAYANVTKIMRLEGAELTAPDRKEIHNIRSLLALGGPGKDLTTEETGVLDNLLSNAKKYITDNVEGVAAKSAYAAFRNTVRHALYGAALTEAEIKSFNEAFGTLGQKLGPVLQQFKTSLSQVKAKLDSIAQLNNPYVSKVLLGADQVKMDEMLGAIQDRLDHLNGIKAGAPKLGIREALQQKLQERGLTPNAQ